MKKMSRIFLIIFIVFSFLNLLHFKSYASDYTGKVQYSNLGAQNTISKGRYTFVYDFSNGIFKTVNIYQDKNKKSVFSIKDVDDILFGSQKIYYSKNIDNKNLKIEELDLKTKKIREIFKIKAGPEPYQKIILEDIVGENLYFTKTGYSIDESKVPLFKLNLKTKKHSIILESNGDISFDENRIFYIDKTENVPISSTLLSCDHNGKNKKEIDKNINNYKIFDKKIYYVKNFLSKNGKKESILYSVNDDGLNKKILTEKMEFIKLENITKDKIIFSGRKSGKTKKYNLELSNGKVVEI